MIRKSQQSFEQLAAEIDSRDEDAQFDLTQWRAVIEAFVADISRELAEIEASLVSRTPTRTPTKGIPVPAPAAATACDFQAPPSPESGQESPSQATEPPLNPAAQEPAETTDPSNSDESSSHRLASLRQRLNQLQTEQSNNASHD